jgi:hypothetical protein
MSFSEDPLETEGAAAPEEPTPEPASFPEEIILPEGFTPLVENAHLPRSRRRQASRRLTIPGATERAALLQDLARRAFPSIEFFLFALLCGAVLGAAYLLESPALLLLGILLAPLLTPWVGFSLASMTGSWRFFLQTFMVMLVASALVFLTGALAGWVGRLWMPLPFFHANIHAHLWWPDLVLVALGAVLLVISFIRSEQKPILPSIMLAYGFFLPISAAGVGWGVKSSQLWPDGALVFLVHLAVAMIASMIVLASLRFKPARAGGYVLTVIVGLFSVAALVSFTGLLTLVSGLGGVLRDGITDTRRTSAAPTVVQAATFTPTVKASSTPTFSPVPSDTPRPTDTLLATPAYAVINSSSGGGALVRTEAGAGSVVATLINGSIVQVLDETQTVGAAVWVKIRLVNNIQGWVLQTVLTATTQAPPITSTPTP